LKKYENLDDSISVQELFKNLERQGEITISIRIKGNQFPAMMVFNHKTEYEPLVKYSEGVILFEPSDNIEISFFYKNTFFVFEAQIVEVFEKSFIIKKPEVIKASFARNSTRYKIKKNESAFLKFQQNAETFKIIEVSTNGLSFEIFSNTISEGDVLKNLLLNLNESLSFYFDAEVKYIKQSKNIFICGVSFAKIDRVSSQNLFHYIFQKYYPNLKSITDFSKDDMSVLYSKITNIGHRTSENENNELLNEIKNIEKVKDKPTISVNLVYEKNNIIMGANSALRIYNHTFFGHKPVMLPDTYLNPKVNADIFIGLSEHLLNNTFFENFITYINSDFEWYIDVFKNISLIINDSEKVSFDKQLCYEYKLDYDIKEKISEYKTEILDNPTEFIKYCGESLSSLERDCFDYHKDGYNLDEIKGIYHTIGYSVDRRLLRTSKNNKIVAYSVAECFTGEINSDNSMDNIKIYLLEDMQDLETILHSILTQIKMFFKIKNKNILRIYIQSSSNLSGDNLNCEFGKKLSINRIMMNRDGMVEIVRLLMSSFEHYTKFHNLSLPQKSIWVTEKFFPGTSIGNVAGTLKIKDKVDYDLLEKAINIFVDKNDAMRIRVIEEKGSPKQYIHDYSYFKIEFLDFSKCDISEFYNWNDKQAQKPFNVIDSTLYYFAIIKISEEVGAFYASTHHLISDAWTMGLLASQVVENYQCLKNDKKISNVKKPSYLDFLIDQDEFRYSNKFVKCREFWSKKYNEDFQIAHLKPISKGNRSTKAERRAVLLDSDLNASIYKYCKEHKLSVFALFMTIFSIYISKKTSVNDVVVGTPILNRLGGKEKQIAGMFVSTIPVRLLVDVNSDFNSYAHYVSKELSGYLRNQKYNYELILKDYREKYKVIDKFYDCLLSYQNAKYEKGDHPDSYEIRWHFNKNQVESLILHLDDREGSGKLLLNIDYLVHLFNEEEIDQVSSSLLNLIKNAISSDGIEISKLEMIDKDEKTILLNTIAKFNDTKAEYPKDMTLQQLFEKQVGKSPNSTALVFEDKVLTYGQLNEKSNQLARQLRVKGVKPDTIVGIMVYRSFEMIIGIMAILKAGGAYLPLDPEYPIERRNYMLENANVKIVLTQKTISDRIIGDFEKIVLDDQELYTGDASNLKTINGPKNLAYVIYTSGSTGMPKGVMIEHYSVINRLNWMQKKYPINESDTILQKTPYTFDVSVWELFWWSFYGGKLAILPPGGEKDPSEVISAIDKYKITTIHFVPSMISVFLDFLQRDINNDKVSSLRQVFASGEALTLKHFERFYSVFDNLNIRLTNLYGPTEATVDVSYFDCVKGEDLKVLPIGKPIDNIRLYVLNNYLDVQPIGTSGELFIAGDGLARGYLNAPDITSQKFTTSKYLKEDRIYKTGDLARLLPSGDIEYLGRMDNQVKIRGLRIELGEIEYQLLRFKSVKEVVVIDRKDETRNSYLCAYYVSDSEVINSEIREHLSKNLPVYMIPSYFVRMEKLPLSDNGKIDRKKLPEPYLSISLEEKYVEPRNAMEKRIAAIWEKELNTDKIGIKSDFFNIGGDSLLAINVSISIGCGVTISDIYKYPTIEGLAKKIQDKKGSDNIFYSVMESENDNGITLVCIPYGGGAPIVYNELGSQLSKISDKYSLYSVTLPGHDFGEKSGIFKPIGEVAQLCVKEIKKFKKTDIVLYGHCVGSALTIEIARLLEKEKINIKAIFIGGIIPPKFVKYYGDILDPWKWKSEESIIKYLNKLGGANYAFGNNEMSLIIKAFRHDVRCYMKYFHDFSENKNSRLLTPVYLVIGESDSSTKNYEKKYKEWLNYCEKVSLITLKDANHYFIKSHAQELARIIQKII
jgi:amino acid adenylation domain-containing protein